MRNNSTGRVCTAGQPWGTLDPFWDFRNESGTNYWINRVIGQVAHDPSMQGGPSAVFFDEVDQGQCGYTRRDTGCDMSAINVTALQAATIAMLPRMVGVLNSRGIVPILSLDNRIAASSDGLANAPAPCALPEDNVVHALKDLQWVRFYEAWPGSFWVHKGPDTDAAMIANAVLEANASVPTALHGAGSCAGGGGNNIRNITRPGPLGGSIEFNVASYLIVASAGSVLSISNNWYDEDFCWWSEFDVDYGTPLGPPVRASSHSWYRNYTRANAEIDVSAGRNGVVTLLA